MLVTRFWLLVFGYKIPEVINYGTGIEYPVFLLYLRYYDYEERKPDAGI
jgi:hypothetical protein